MITRTTHVPGLLKRILRMVAVTLAILAGGVDHAGAVDSPSCPDAKLFSGKLITDICWRCIFPIKVAGIPLGRSGDIPKKATNKSVCFCNDSLGIPMPGLTVGMWAPARIFEFVRKPGCSPTLNGITLPIADWRYWGTDGAGDFDNSDLVFYHYHSYAFPLLIILNLFFQENCVADGYFDFDLIMPSELDPTWNDEALSFFTQPEAAAVANPIAIAACVADAVASTAGDPIDELFWCSGTWSHLYPFAGYNGALGSLAENTSALHAKALAVGHRRGLMWNTMGSDALCGGYVDPMFPKSMYKYTMFFPVPHTKDAFVNGESDFRWGGQNRRIPATGEDTVYITWRWTDCCTSKQ